MTDKMQETVTYQDAVNALAIAELEVAGEARRIDPNGTDRDLMAKTASLIDAMETYVCVLFEVEHDDLRDAVGQVDQAVIQKYLQKRAMMAAEESGN